MIRAANTVGKSSWSNKTNAAPVCITSKTAIVPSAMNAKTEDVSTSIKLFPNPATTGEFSLILPAGTVFPASLQMFSMTGQKVLQIELNDCSNIISTENLINGLYIISVQCNGMVQKLKLQINRK